MSAYSREKEYIREAFMLGHLDITSSYETVERFVSIMFGEMEALIAIDHAHFLTDDQKIQLLQLAKPNDETKREYLGWLASISGPKTEQPS